MQTLTKHLAHQLLSFEFDETGHNDDENHFEFCEFFKSCKQLTSLIFRCGDVLIFGTVLSHCPNIQYIFMFYGCSNSDFTLSNDLICTNLKAVSLERYSSIATQNILRALSKCSPNLTSLTLKDNNFIKTDLKMALISVLSNCTKLRILQLNWCEIENESDLFDSIIKCPNLAYLDMNLKEYEYEKLVAFF